MKKSRLCSPDHRVRTVACSVSAAALMLGVSQAATVGFNLQCDWDDAGAPSYTGKAVTATAFGIAPLGWENLTPMPTGYGSGDSGPFVGFNEVIDTTTSSGGLNPLPQGSIAVTWSATAANASGFKGYGPSYSAPNPHPGSQQVYYGFLRDEKNIYTSPTNPPGAIPYSVTISGLKSVWTNTPYAIQLIAATDTGMLLTNAFISSSTSTQMVAYDTTNLTYANGIMGGLSTMSGPWTNDSLSIYGAPASYGYSGKPETGYAIASTIAGFIITDKPVISMLPQPVLVCGGDTVTWSGYAVGVPPLAYQWRKNGVPIPGATTSSYSLTNVGPANVGSYDLWVTNLYGAASSSPVTVGDEISTLGITNLVSDSNPNGPQHNGLDNGAIWLASSTDGGGVTRTGVMSFSTNAPSQITVAGETNFDSSAGTIMLWMRSSGLADPSGNPATLFDRLSGTGNGSGVVVAQDPDGTVLFQIGSGTSAVAGITSMANTLSNNRWHQVAVVYDQSGSTPSAIYIDGQPDSSLYLSPWTWPAGQELELGLSHDTNSWQAYNGLMDDVRFYNRALSATEISSAYGGALVDTTALVMQLNFTAAPGSGASLTWQCTDAILQSADSVNGPYTDVPGAVSPYSVSVQTGAKFYRYRGHTPVVIVANPYLM